MSRSRAAPRSDAPGGDGAPADRQRQPATSTSASSPPRGTASASSRTRARSPARYFPEYANRYGWVFLGDILAPADQLARRGGRPRRVRRRRPLRQRQLGRRARLHRQRGQPDAERGAVAQRARHRQRQLHAAHGHDFSLGDFIEVDIAQLEWMPTRVGRTSIFVGKFDSVIGIEYRERKANQRFGITPSLIARYTTGTPLGIKVRSKFGDDDRRGPRGRADQRLVDHRAVPLLRRDRQQRRQDRQRPAVGAAAARSGPRDRRCRAVRRAGPRARQPRPDVVLGRRPARPHRAASTSRRSGCRARGRASAPTASTIPTTAYGLDLKQRRLPRARLDDHAAHRRLRAAASSATRSSGWGIPTLTGRALTGST